MNGKPLCNSRFMLLRYISSFCLTELRINSSVCLADAIPSFENSYELQRQKSMSHEEEKIMRTSFPYYQTNCLVEVACT